MSFNLDELITRRKHDNNNGADRNTDVSDNNSSNSDDSTSSASSSHVFSTSSSPSSSSDGSSSSSELNPNDALQSPLTGLLNFEGFSMPQISNFGISHIDMPNLPSLPTLRSFNMPRFQPRLPNLANNLATNLPNLPNLPNFQNLTTNMRNLSYLTQLRNVNTAAELQNMFNLFRISTNLRNNLPEMPQLPQLPQLPQFPQLPPLAPFFTGHFSGAQLLKPWTQLRDSVVNMHRRLNDITQRFPNCFHFHEWRSQDGIDFVRIYFLLNDFIYFCDSPTNYHVHQHNNSTSYNAKRKHLNLSIDQQQQPSAHDEQDSFFKNGETNQQHHNHPEHHHGHNRSQTRPSPSTSNSSGMQYQHSLQNKNSDSAVPNPNTSRNYNTDRHHHHPNHHNHHYHHHTTSNSSKHEILNTQPLHPLNLIADARERIDSYEYDQKSCRFVFSNGKNLYYFDDHPSQTTNANHSIKIETKYDQVKTDFKICPSNSNLVAYLCNGDLWCVDLKTSQELRLTNLSSSLQSRNYCRDSSQTPLSEYLTATYLSSIENNEQIINALPLLFGRPSHVIKEEFRRHQGFWWQPDVEYQIVSGAEDGIEYQILFEETNQSQVDLVMMPSHNGLIEAHRFPKTGSTNPVSHLKIVKFKYSSNESKLSEVVVIDTLPRLNLIYPEYEYLIRAGWLGQDIVWCQLLNRRQTNLVIALISLSSSFESQIIYEEHNDLYWISVHDILYFLDTSKLETQPLSEGSELSFIWSSEESGFRHLYLIKMRLGSAKMSPKMIMKKQLTEGNWEINDKDFWVDEDNHLIYFCALRDTPLERHLYVLKYSTSSYDERHNNQHGKCKLHRLTELNFTQSSIAFNPNRTIFVNIQSNISVPPFGFVNRIVPHAKSHTHHRNRDHLRRLPDSKRLALLLVNSFIYSSYESPNLNKNNSIERKPSITYECQADLLPGLGKPELFCCQLASGEVIYGSIFKPEFMESGVRYPTVLEVYGGPEVQLVSNSFMNLRQPTRHLLSSEGYVVVLIDCRGSGRRGLSFEAHSSRRMGQVELADQVEVLQWLAKNTGYIDLDRIAVKGWSYGGYLALMALAQYPKIFKIAIAGAPVTNWLTYDTAYTERFMGLPSENTEGYLKGNVLNYVHHFPDQENRLLLLHGMMDENVHFTHTVSLINALIEAGKPYDLQVFPGERHELKSSSSCENYMTCVLSYLQLNL